MTRQNALYIFMSQTKILYERLSERAKKKIVTEKKKKLENVSEIEKYVFCDTLISYQPPPHHITVFYLRLLLSFTTSKSYVRKSENTRNS